MSVRVMSRVALWAVFASALALAAPDSMAFSSVTQSGTAGDWGVPDNPIVGQESARCFYGASNASGTPLQRVRVRPPTIWGAYSTTTWVGWRFKILRSTNGGATYKAVYTSPTWKGKASQALAPSFAFQNWYAPKTTTQARIRVQETLFWYKPGTKSTIEGKAAGQDDNYSAKFLNGLASYTANFCYVIQE